MGRLLKDHDVLITYNMKRSTYICIFAVIGSDYILVKAKFSG